VELFPSKVASGRLGDRVDRDSRLRSPAQRRRIENSHPLFSGIVQTVSSSDQPKGPYRPDEPIDLFPNKVGGVKRAAMDSPLGITPRNVSLENRINDTKFPVELFPDRVKKPLDEMNSGKSLAERIQDSEGGGGARELFPEMLRRGGGGRRRRRAEDHF
jgi:hypothetical protein